MPPTAPMVRTSERTTWKRCPQKWQWAWVDGLVRRGEYTANALWFGQGLHLALAGWYTGPGLERGVHPAETFEAWIGEETRRIRINAKGDAAKFDEDEFIDAKDLGIAMLKHYIEHYGADQSWHIIQPEQTFQINIPSLTGKSTLAIYCGTYDLVYIDEETDYLWLGEHKGYKAIQLGHLPLDDQVGSYWMSAAAVLDAEYPKIVKKRPLEGIMYNILRKAPPDARPQNARGEYLNKDGTVSLKQPSPYFHREPVTRDPVERVTQVHRIQAEVTVMNAQRRGKIPLWKTPTKDCTWDCAFQSMCELHEQGQDWEEYRDAVFKPADPYADHRKSAAE